MSTEALNNALGRPFCSDADMEKAVDNLLETARQEGSREVRADHARANGWYSSEAIANAVTTVSMHHAGHVEYCMRLQPLYLSPSDIHGCVGAVVNINDLHWVAVKSVGGQIWFLDSQERQPSKMKDEQYKKFLSKRRAAYPIVWAEDMKGTKEVGAGDEFPAVSGASGASSSQDGGDPMRPVLPLTRQDTADSSQPVESQDDTASASAADEHTLGDTAVPALMVAEIHGRALSSCELDCCMVAGLRSTW